MIHYTRITYLRAKWFRPTNFFFGHFLILQPQISCYCCCRITMPMPLWRLAVK